MVFHLPLFFPYRVQWGVGACAREGGCVVKGLVLCPYCDTLKMTKFRVAACKEKATMEAADAAAEGAGEEEDPNPDDGEAEREATAPLLP